jgi:hypothetical protein
MRRRAFDSKVGLDAEAASLVIPQFPTATIAKTQLSHNRLDGL